MNRLKKWYKGDIHQHSLWSDGTYLPERMADWYRQNGYHFICLSDHNIFQDDELRFFCNWNNPKIPDINDKIGFQNTFAGETSYWKPVRQEGLRSVLTQRILDEHQYIYGNTIETRTFEGITFVRLKTFDELARSKNVPGKFLMIPGFELSTISEERGHHIHMNFINVRETFSPFSYGSAYNILKQNFKRGERLYSGQNYLAIANHPLFPYYDFQPSDLIRLPQITLYELTNNCFALPSMRQIKEAWSPEQMWDVVNAYRIKHDQPVLYGIGSDDFHHMEMWGIGWIVVRAMKLEIPDILDAIRMGDFYASNGLDFKEIQFDGKTLEVEIDVQEEGEYVIDFIGTKKDYDPACKYIEVGYERGKSLPRKLECYSSEIGKVFSSVEGIKASYTLMSDDLYVRAKIHKKHNQKTNANTKEAWTQPFRR